MLKNSVIIFSSPYHRHFLCSTPIYHPENLLPSTQVEQPWWQSCTYLHTKECDLAPLSEPISSLLFWQPTHYFEIIYIYKVKPLLKQDLKIKIILKSILVYSLSESFQNMSEVFHAQMHDHNIAFSFAHQLH